MDVDKEELKNALYRAVVAEKIADKALDMALKALTKVEAMEKSTHKAYFVNPETGAPKLNPEPPFEPVQQTQKDMEQQLDKLFESTRTSIDEDDVFLDEM